MYHQVRLNNLCSMSLLLIIICLVCEIRNDIICAAHYDAVSALDESEFPAPKKNPPPELRCPLSPNTQMMAESIEKSGFIKGENDMVNVFQWVDHVTKDKKVTVVMTLSSGVNKKDCEINLTIIKWIWLVQFELNSINCDKGLLVMNSAHKSIT